MAEHRPQRSPYSYPSEAQVSSRLTAGYAAASLLALVLVALGVLVAWPRWRAREVAAAERAQAASRPQILRRHAPEERATRRARPTARGSHDDARPLPST